MSDQIDSTEEIRQLLSNPPTGITFHTHIGCQFNKLHKNYTVGAIGRKGPTIGATGPSGNNTYQIETDLQKSVSNTIHGLLLSISFTTNTDDLFNKTLKKFQNYVENNSELVLTHNDNIFMLNEYKQSTTKPKHQEPIIKPEYQEIFDKTKQNRLEHDAKIQKYVDKIDIIKKEMSQSFGCKFYESEDDDDNKYGFDVNYPDDCEFQANWYSMVPCYQSLNITIKCHQNTEFYKLCMESDVIQAVYQQHLASIR